MKIFPINLITKKKNPNITAFSSSMASSTIQSGLQFLECLWSGHSSITDNHMIPYEGSMNVLLFKAVDGMCHLFGKINILSP